MNRMVPLLLATLALGAPLAAQDPKPAKPAPAPKPSAAQVGAAYAEIEGLIDTIRATPPADRSKLLDRLYAACGAFLGDYLAVASQDQLSLAGRTWLQLAARAADTDAMRKRLAALAKHKGLPADLERLVRLHTARLKMKVGAKAPAWSDVDMRGGERVEGSKLGAKLVLLNFWTGHNPNSRSFMERKLAPLYERFKSKKDFLLVGVGVDTHPSAAPDTTQAPWLLVSDADASTATAFGIADVPFLVLLDEKRTILAYGPGWRVVHSVEALLSEKLEPKPDED